MRYWINPKRFRYYQASLVLDLFGDWTLVCAWGGLGTRRGNRGITGLSSYAEGRRKLEALDAYRQKRGYVPVCSFADWVSQIAKMRATRFPPLPNPPPQRPENVTQKLVLE